MFISRRILPVVLLMVAAMALWMGWFYWFKTDHQGHRLDVVGTPEAQAAGQRLLGRADGLMRQQHFTEARHLLDSLRDADHNPDMHLEENELLARYDSLYRRRERAGQ